jgi:ribosomal RNA-processing protein 12
MEWMKVELKVCHHNMILSLFPEHMRKAAASIDEYMTMVAGGLAGASPHMISATVTAISRLVFEFKSK